MNMGLKYYRKITGSSLYPVSRGIFILFISIVYKGHAKFSCIWPIKVKTTKLACELNFLIPSPKILRNTVISTVCFFFKFLTFLVFSNSISFILSSRCFLIWTPPFSCFRWPMIQTCCRTCRD